MASVLIVLFSAAAVTAAVLLEVDDTKARFFAEAPPTLDLGPTATRAEAGDPRTFLLLGSDERVGDDEAGRKPRSDTIVLVRADPRRDAITVMSIPRDLRVVLPGYGVDKINGAYERNGPKGTVAALKRLFEDAGGRRLEVNHVLNLDFAGFRRAVGYIGGVYVDVDRRYFNDNSPPTDSVTPYATIDVQPGYQRLGGQDALDYVRYRHGDDDFIRAARQQDFLRQVRGQPSVRKLLRLQDRDRLAAVFGKYVQVDRSFRSTKTLVSLLKLGAYLRDARIQSVRFPGVPSEDGIYVDADPARIRQALDRFLTPAAPAKAERVLERRATPSRSRSGSKPPTAAEYRRGLRDARAETRSTAAAIARRLNFPVYYPTRKTPGSTVDDRGRRTYRIKTLASSRYGAYRFVLSTGNIGEYYGVQGTAWREPPILIGPDRIQEVGGRRLLLFADGSKLRVVGWRTNKGAYWVSNTLNRALSNREMIGLAVSLFRAPRKR